MAQYDLLLTQNVHESGVEFTEKYVNIGKGGILSADANGAPTVLPAGTNGYKLISDTAETTGLKWVEDIPAVTDALVFKGTVGVGGTYEIAAFNALATYSVGWTYKVVTAGTIKGKVCEVGDMLIAIVERTGSDESNDDWTVVQTNIDGAVTGPAAAPADGDVVLFDGVTGRIIKSGGALGTMAFEATGSYVAKALFNAQTILAATTDNTPAAVTVAEQTLVGRKTGGNIAALTAAEAMNVLWVTAPASKTASGIAGQIAKDANFIYVCTATDTWKRSPIATNW